MGKLIDLTGKTFGRLKVIKRNKDASYINGEAIWICECSCSKKTIVNATSGALRSGKKKSCGCLWKPDYEEFIYKLKERLVRYSKLNGQCIEWTGFKDKNGYGELCVTKNGKEKPEKAHRVSWIVHRGPIPNNMYVLHKCDNPSCHRIEHLFLGSPKDNMTDKMNKGRHVFPKGSKCVRSKLKEYQVEEILKLKGISTSPELAKIYNVAPSTIRQIWQRRSWKQVKE